MKSLEEIRLKLLSIKLDAEKMNEDSFDKTRAFKFVYNEVLNMIDELEYLEEDTDLLDDDWFEKKPEVKKESKLSKPTSIIDIDDLL